MQETNKINDRKYQPTTEYVIISHLIGRIQHNEFCDIKMGCLHVYVCKYCYAVATYRDYR